MEEFLAVLGALGGVNTIVSIELAGGTFGPTGL